jgi:hypothetical protein
VKRRSLHEMRPDGPSRRSVESSAAAKLRGLGQVLGPVETLAGRERVLGPDLS